VRSEDQNFHATKMRWRGVEDFDWRNAEAGMSKRGHEHGKICVAVDWDFRKDGVQIPLVCCCLLHSINGWKDYIRNFGEVFWKQDIESPTVPGERERGKGRSFEPR